MCVAARMPVRVCVYVGVYGHVHVFCCECGDGLWQCYLDLHVTLPLPVVSANCVL